MANEHSDFDTNPQHMDLLRVCRIGRAQGLKGEVTVEVFTDEPERRFAPGSRLMTNDGRYFTVERSRTFKQRWILLFDSVPDRTAAESLRDLVLYTPADTLQQMAEENAWYPKDLIGLEVRMTDGNTLGLPAGLPVGHVTDVLAGSAQSLLEVSLDIPASHDVGLHGDTGHATGSPADMTSASHAGNTPSTFAGNPPAVPNDDIAAAPAIRTDSVEHPATALIPFVEQLVPTLDMSNRVILIDPPHGLIPELEQ